MWAFSRCRRPGRTRSPSTTRRRRSSGSFATRASASGRSMCNRRGTPTPSRSLRGSAATPPPESVPFGAALPTSPSAGGPPLSKQELEILAERYPSQLHISTQFALDYFFLNTRVPPFDDVRARRAVNRAFDRNAFAEGLGRGFKPTCQILPPNFPGYHPTCPYGSSGVTGLDGARKLVRNAGATGAAVAVWVPSRTAKRGGYMVSVLDSLGFRARLKVVPSRQACPISEKVGDSRSKAQIGFGAMGRRLPVRRRLHRSAVPVRRLRPSIAHKPTTTLLNSAIARSTRR